jgi:hypothetical protein
MRIPVPSVPETVQYFRRSLRTDSSCVDFPSYDLLRSDGWFGANEAFREEEFDVEFPRPIISNLYPRLDCIPINYNPECIVSLLLRLDFWVLMRARECGWRREPE